ncbi:Uracil phosphoribosyltransferase [Phytophthora citrophthora]|uniref:Uracil phosphoribosyltransferase n=1 Tax=Phytophthora citrophthora TaxID=4793 RepID=A0AAD9GQR1_9STRA|nr:Uracil phosphoribosyltransferase [Phytophthora citrophthora]
MMHHPSPSTPPYESDTNTNQSQGRVRVQGKRNAPEDFDSDTEMKRPALEISPGVSPFAVNQKPRKRPNYLDHAERCRIIRRVDLGESQASLAREFGVTRAAVCQLYKKREAILARGEPERASEIMSPTTEIQVRPTTHLEGIRTTSRLQPEKISDDGVKRESKALLPTVDVRSSTVKLLIRALKHPATSVPAFERAATRLSIPDTKTQNGDRILIEEAFAHFDRQVEAEGRSNQSEVKFCGITLGGESSSFITSLLQIDRNAHSGEIHVKLEQDNRPSWKLVYLDVPDIITDLKILLFSTSGNGGAECKAIEALQSIGVQERNISLVMVVCSRSGYEEITTRYPNTKIITATIDNEWNLEGGLHPTQ